MSRLGCTRRLPDTGAGPGMSPVRTRAASSRRSCSGGLWRRRKPWSGTARLGEGLGPSARGGGGRGCGRSFFRIISTSTTVPSPAPGGARRRSVTSGRGPRTPSRGGLLPELPPLLADALLLLAPACCPACLLASLLACSPSSLSPPSLSLSLSPFSFSLRTGAGGSPDKGGSHLNHRPSARGLGAVGLTARAR
eukprot:817808-Alexandrium_andersonii.AAC.1